MSTAPTPALLEDKATQLKLGDYDKLASDAKQKVIDQLEQEYLPIYSLTA